MYIPLQGICEVRKEEGKMQEEQAGSNTCENAKVSSVEQQFIELIATIIVNKIFKDYVFEKSDNVPTDIKR